MSEKFGVIGLGRFGYQVAVMLAQYGMEVLAIDSTESIINSIRDQVTQAVCIRVSDEASLRSIGVDEMETVIVSMGENLAQSILMTALLKKRLGIQRVIARAINDIHRDILILVGADEVLLPEKEIGILLADRLSSPCHDIMRVQGLTCVATIEAPQRFIGRTVHDINLLDAYAINCVGIKQHEMVVLIPSDYIVKSHDLLVCVGHKDDLERVALL